MGEYKPFDPVLKNKYDNVSRKKAKQYFLKKGIVLTDNPDIFGIDLISQNLA